MKLYEEMPELTGATAWLNGQYDKCELIGKKPVLFHFWSISCRLCKESMPAVNTLRNLYRGEMNTIAVHMPRSEGDLDLQQIKKVAAMHNITHPIFIDNNLELTNAFDTRYVPAYYVFDKNGKLRHIQEGGSGLNMLKKRVNRLVNEVKHNY